MARTTSMGADTPQGPVSDLDQLVSLGFTADELDRIRSIIVDSASAFAPNQPVLCHGDVYPDHVFVDDSGRVCGLIDWGLWRGGTAVADLAWASMRHDPDDFAALLQGHEKGSADANLMRAIAACAVVWDVLGIAWRISVGDSEDLQMNIATLRHNLARADFSS